MAINELNVNFASHYPRLQISGRRGVLSKSIEGNWATSFKGRGVEFTGFRAYTYNDDASLIDWKASLRSKDVLVREFEEFKNFKVIFLLDVSDSMLFSTTNKLKAEYGAELVYAISQSALHAGDAIGLAMVSDGVIASVEPSFGKGMRHRFEKVLSNKINYGGKKDFKKSLFELDSLLDDRTIIIFVSDFLNLPENWERYLRIISMRHHVMGIMLKDKRDRELSGVKGQFVLQDMAGSQSMYVDAKHLKKEYYFRTLEQENYVFDVFRKLKSGCVRLINGDPYEKSLQHFFVSLHRMQKG
ncbi:MAG: DUF58 domain-containing protein [Nanobdellota archaeon]